MLFSSIGFSMDIHFCGGEIETIGFYDKADQCNMMKKAEMQTKSHACCSAKTETVSHCQTKSTENTVKKGSCCTNEQFTLQSTDDAQTSTVFNLTNIDLTFVTLYIFNQVYNFEPKTEINNFDYYSPPPIPNDVTILHQVFII